ncbi:uroporphyrinogen decarboxylase family protein [Abortiporus biennis]
MVEFPPLKNDLLLRAARGEETERAPVWVMRQAGRYLPEFRKKSHDILVVPQAMGMEVQMTPGPYFPDPLNTPADIEKLTKNVDVNKELGYVFEAITMTRKALDGEVPLIGFCGAPWTLFAYMIEGGGSKTFQKAKTWLFRYPEESKALLLRIADVCVDFLVGQVKAGAQLLQVFDSWAGELGPRHFEEFSFPSLQSISSRVKAKLAAENIPLVPMTLFAKGANESIVLLAEKSGYDVLGLDWCIEPSKARQLVGDKVALQGNMDPNFLYAGKDAIEKEVKKVAESFRGGKAPKGWVANLGHGITPGVDPEDLKWFFQCIHKYSSST